MRKPVALVAILAFANLLISQASGFCPLAGQNHQESAQTMSAHESHHAPPPASHSHGADGVTDAPSSGENHSCLAVGACVLSVDLDRSLATDAIPQAQYRVMAVSDAAPRSQIPPPDSPPPRA